MIFRMFLRYTHTIPPPALPMERIEKRFIE
jgi:hypothetical protein